ncbi:MAG: nucleoside triphosphate pyrophosphohydrolase [Treponema sp.]|nr:nucleoside triphosphate pyrophosphohydrolase [Treponema sp.]
MLNDSELTLKLESLSAQAAAFNRLCEIMKRLRSKTGCSWDKAQTPQTLRQTFIEETFETIDAINDDDALHVREELGDVFFNLVFIAECYSEQGKFTAADSLNEVCEKLVRRHPHVFDDSPAKTVEQVVNQWENIKQNVEGRKTESIIDSVPKGFPPLLRAVKILKKCAKSGFDWRSVEQTASKVLEEYSEVEQEFKKEKINRNALEEELGDFLFASVNLCRKLDVDPNAALEKAIQKFSKRFKYVEKSMKEHEISFSAENDDKMLEFWKEAKKL